MKKTILTLLAINFNLTIFLNYQLYQSNSTFLKTNNSPRFYRTQTNPPFSFYDAKLNQFYKTNFSKAICLNSWKDHSLKSYMIDNKTYIWYVEDEQYYYQVDDQEFMWDINDDAFKFKAKPIIDLNFDYQPITTKRGWNGTLYEDDKQAVFISTLTLSDYLTCDTYSMVFKKIIKAFHAKASLKSCEEFDQFINQKAFFSFKHLVNVINNHNLTHLKSQYIDVPLEQIANRFSNRKEFEEIILLLYNTLSYFFW